MFCVVMASAMNRSEQEKLFRQSREVIIKTSSSRETLADVTPNKEGAGEDIVLSVLKSPIISTCPSYTDHHRNNHQQHPGTSSEDDAVFEDQDLEERRGLRNVANSSPEVTSRFNFFGEQLRRFRNPRGPRFGEAHHKRVPTPIKKRRHRYNHDAASRYRTKSDDLEDEDIGDEMDDVDDDDKVVDGVENVSGTGGKKGSGHAGRGPPGVPDPYYPIYLPIDQAFKAKYVFHHKKGRTFQERVYVFLEHPGGWLCFIYHFTV
jgi:hypothetical protein